MYNILRFLMRQFVMYEGEPGAGGGTSTPTPSPTPSPTPTPSPAPAGAWYDKFENTEVKDWLKAYGQAYPHPEAVAMKALNLEKFVGAEKAGRGVIIPKADAKSEEWKAFWQKAGGVPATIDGYKLEGDLAKDPVLARFRETAHKMSMPPVFYNGLLEWVGSEVKGMKEAEVKQFEANATKELAEVETEWGANYNAKSAAGQRAARAFIPGTPEERTEVLTRMEGALGTKFTMNFWARLGEAIGEHAYVDGGGQPSGGMTVEAARARIEVLKRDKEWGTKFINGGADEKAEWDKLHKIAYPAPQPQ